MSREFQIGDLLVADSPNGQAKPVVVTVTGIITNSNTGEVVAYMAGKRKIRPEEIHHLAPGRPEPGSVSEALDRINTADSEPETNERAKVLSEAEQLINGDRAQAYGDPETNFGRLAKLWAPILGAEITPTQVALCLTQLKISRLINTPDHRDSYIDAAGYIALGAELAKDKK